VRNLKFVIYILAALVTGALSHEANATPSFKLSTKKLDVSNIAALNNTAKHVPAFHFVHEGKTLVAWGRASDLAQATTFSDIQGNWARSFIEALAAQNIIRGFPDGSFRPDAPVTRAEFAAMISKAFQKNPIREAIAFVDVPANHWAVPAIQSAYQTGFLQGYPNSVFMPNQSIPRVQALVSLANGLNLPFKAEPATVLNTSFQDAAQIPEFAHTRLAAATENRLVVNYPNVALLKPNQVATRGEAAAFIYQALASTGKVPSLNNTDIATQYIVGYQPVAQQPTPPNPQQVADLRQRFRLPVPPLTQVVRPDTFTGSTVSSPTAFGANWGDVFIAGSYQARARYTNRDDGGVVFGFGLGDARRLVGLEVAVSSYSTFRQGFFQNGGVSLKLHRLLNHDTAIAFGIENVGTWGSPDAGSNSVYGVGSHIFRLRANPEASFSKLIVSVGVGGGRFRSEHDVRRRIGSTNVFGSVGLQVIPLASVIADWTGQDLFLGASIVPFRRIPLSSFQVLPT